MLSFRTVMAANEMETDEHTHLPASNGLRRSNSAPNISVAVCTQNTPTFHSLSLPRQRRFSVNSPNQNVAVSMSTTWIVFHDHHIHHDKTTLMFLLSFQTVGSPASRVTQLIRVSSCVLASVICRFHRPSTKR